MDERPPVNVKVNPNIINGIECIVPVLTLTNCGKKLRKSVQSLDKLYLRGLAKRFLYKNDLPK